MFIITYSRMSRLTRDGTAEPVSRDQILRRERGQGKKKKNCLADHEQDWQPYPVGPYPDESSADYTYIIIYCIQIMHNNNTRYAGDDLDTTRQYDNVCMYSMWTTQQDARTDFVIMVEQITLTTSRWGIQARRL